MTQPIDTERSHEYVASIAGDDDYNCLYPGCGGQPRSAAVHQVAKCVNHCSHDTCWMSNGVCRAPRSCIRTSECYCGHRCDFSPAPPVEDGTHEFKGHSDAPQTWCVVPVEGTESGYCGRSTDAPVHKISEICGDENWGTICRLSKGHGGNHSEVYSRRDTEPQRPAPESQPPARVGEIPMGNEELKSCPYCGAPLLRSLSYLKYFEVRHKDDCFLVGDVNSFPRLIHLDSLSRWNARASTPSPLTPEGLDAIIDAIPTSWLDSLLTGPDAVLHGKGGTWGCPDIERLLSAIKERQKAIASELMTVTSSPSVQLRDEDQSAYNAAEMTAMQRELIGPVEYERLNKTPWARSLVHSLVQRIANLRHNVQVLSAPSSSLQSTRDNALEEVVSLIHGVHAADHQPSECAMRERIATDVRALATIRPPTSLQSTAAITGDTNGKKGK
jgi:hypothetical protein